MNKTIIIPRTLANRLLTFAQAAPQAEICGLISTDTNNKYRVYPIDNIADDSGCIFEMNPQQQISAFKQIRDEQQELFAIYHSHPNSEALPSKKDQQDAAYTDALNIIISLNTKGVLDMRGYFYREDGVETVDLIIE